MQITRLSLEHFRSYRQLSLDLQRGTLHIFCGANGAGKTNLLEAMTVLSLAKSCLGTDEMALLHWGEQYYRLQCTMVQDSGEERTLEIFSQFHPRRQKACFRNDVATGLADVIGLLPTVVFLPQELELFTGSPMVRRRFLDQVLCQVNPAYLRSLIAYQRIVRQRNALLRSVAERRVEEAELKVWDAALAREGAFVTLRRIELMEVLQCTLAEEIRTLGEQGWTDLHLQYLREGSERTDQAAADELLQQLGERRSRDLQLQSTSVGPHREDWQCTVAGRSLALFASRGQQRTVVLALLFLQASYLELARNERPVLLLDDVFSELDENHRRSLLQTLKRHQMFLTCTHVPEVLPPGAVVWAVKPGVVEPL